MFDYDIYPVRLRRKRIFRIATGASTYVDDVLLRIRHEGIVGWGAACRNNVTGETRESIARDLKLIADFTRSTNSLDPDEILPAVLEQFADSPAAVAAFDIALYDLTARKANRSLCTYLADSCRGSVRASIATDNTIGIDTLEVTLELAKAYVDAGFRAIKLKIGMDLEADLMKIADLRRCVGPDVRLLADGNQGYDVEQALTCCQQLRKHDYMLFEQPVDMHDLDALGEVTRRSEVPVYADEAARGVAVAEQICRRKLAHGINIKLMKFGGLHPALRVVRMAEQAGLNLMVGCYGETSVSLAAALHLALAFPHVQHADLDSHLTLTSEPCSSLQLAHGLLTADGPGLGIDVDLAAIQAAGQ
jgi:L-alanine-DL-glutamate epimerase-like enolase superfamily enzyme